MQNMQKKYAKYVMSIKYVTNDKKYAKYAKYVSQKIICRICTPHFADDYPRAAEPEHGPRA
jgi:hypothetical protein